MSRPAKDMSLATFTNIINQIRGKTEYISLQGFGEPLLHPEIEEMIKIAGSAGIRTGISTNATVLDKKMAIKLLNSGLDYLIFAFDGACKKTYEDIRKGAKYELVSENIHNFLKLKIKMKNKIFIVLQCIYMKETEKEIDKFKKKWQIGGVDALRIRQLTQSISRYDPETRRKFLNRHDIPCYWLWSEPAVYWNGTVVACCQDVNARLPLGNINKKKLDDIWNNKLMQNLRQLHQQGKRDKISICKDCNMYQPNIASIIGSSFFNVFTLNKLLPWVETLISSLRYQ